MSADRQQSSEEWTYDEYYSVMMNLSEQMNDSLHALRMRIGSHDPTALMYEVRDLFEQTFQILAFMVENDFQHSPQELAFTYEELVLAVQENYQLDCLANSKMGDVFLIRDLKNKRDDLRDYISQPAFRPLLTFAYSNPLSDGHFGKRESFISLMNAIGSAVSRGVPMVDIAVMFDEECCADLAVILQPMIEDHPEVLRRVNDHYFGQPSYDEGSFQVAILDWYYERNSDYFKPQGVNVPVSLKPFIASAIADLGMGPAFTLN